MIVLRRKQFGLFSFNNFKQAFTGKSTAGRAAVNTQRQNLAKTKMEADPNLSATEARRQANQEIKMEKDLTGAQRWGAFGKGVGNTALLAGGTAIGAGALGLGAVNSMGSSSFDALKGNMGSNSEGY